jgi:AcrR family transcriptional regulator
MSIASSKKGLKTKNDILEASKELFYENGFFSTSIQNICDLSGVTAGTFTYYFKTKDDLIRELYGSVWHKCYDYVEQYLTREVDSLQKNTMVAFPYYYSFLHDEKTRSFHREILMKGSVKDYIAPVAIPVSKQFLIDFHLNFSDQELMDIDTAENGLSREIIMDYLDNPEKRSLTDLINTIYIFRARLFTFDEDLMKIYLFNAMELARRHDHSHIRLLR